jgi:hypothetical protein
VVKIEVFDVNSFACENVQLEVFFANFGRGRALKDQSSNLQPYEKMIYSERA